MEQSDCKRNVLGSILTHSHIALVLQRRRLASPLNILNSEREEQCLDLRSYLQFVLYLG